MLNLNHSVDRSQALFDKGRYLETMILSFLTLTVEYGYDKDEEFISVIKENQLLLLYILIHNDANKDFKILSRKLLEMVYGEETIDNLFYNIAPVTDRDDRLVRRWKSHCLERDNYKCVKCSSDKQLCVHHISYWSNDPINRINVENGITLCHECHKKEHECDWFSNFV